MGVTSEVGLITDRDLYVPTLRREHDVFYTSEIPEVTWYEPLYNAYIIGMIGLVGFYGLSTLLGYLIPNPLYTFYA